MDSGLKQDMRIFFYSSLFLFLLVGCQQSQSPNKEPEEEQVLIYVVYPDHSPVQDFIIALSETGESAPDIGMELAPTNEEGKTEANLRVGATYVAALVIEDKPTQYEEFTVSENAEDNEFTFTLED